MLGSGKACAAATTCQFYVPIVHASIIEVFAVAPQQAKQSAASQQAQQAKSRSMHVHEQRQHMC